MQFRLISSLASEETFLIKNLASLIASVNVKKAEIEQHHNRITLINVMEKLLVSLLVQITLGKLLSVIDKALDKIVKAEKCLIWILKSRGWKTSQENWALSCDDSIIIASPWLFWQHWIEFVHHLKDF